MSSSAAITTDKGTHAAELRTEAATLTKELAQAKEKLEIASKPLAGLESKRDELAAALADGKGVKLNAVAEIRAAIETAELPLKILRSRVTEKETALSQVRTNLAAIEREISIDAAKQARTHRFNELATRLRGVTGEVAELFQLLIESKLPELDSAVRDLTAEFVNVGGMLNTGFTPESNAARAEIQNAVTELWDGAFLRAERARLRQGWQPRGEGPLGQFVVRTLVPPR